MRQKLADIRQWLAQKRTRGMAGLLSASLALAILYVCLLPGSDLPKVPLSDKIEHVIAYIALSAPLAVWFGPKRLGAAVCLAVLYGGFVEVAQGLAGTGRSASWLDALANAAGAVIGAGSIAFLLWRTRRA